MHDMDPLDSGKPAARSGLQELFKAREKEALKWVVSPLKDLKGKKFKSFHVRHEASMLELFFDLFFVANLATFTAYHEITTSSNVAAYIGFFLILWSTWFQITIFDVRFAADSVFERVCKLCQFISFVIFAAVGANFNPGTYESMKYYRIYETMATVIGLVRLLLAIQYTIVAAFVCRKYKNLIIPFILIISTFLISGACFIATSWGFKYKSISHIHVVWWVLLPVESLIIVTISSIWRMLSFKETHMNERLSLLTMIIIGEGVIGVSKTVGYLWPTEEAPTGGNIIAILSIVAMLLLVWQMYFDNHPHGDYGTIKQQWWALSHFFLHLGIVGTVEGSNRMAVVYYATQVYMAVWHQVDVICTMVPSASRQDFVGSLNYTLQYLKLDTYDPRGYDWTYYYLNETLYPSSTPNFCDLDDDESVAITVRSYLVEGIFKRFKINAAPIDGAYFHTLRVTYIYLWCSFALTLFMLLLFLWIVRRKKHDALEVVRMSSRMLIAIVAIALACMAFIETTFFNFVTSPWVVATICVLLSLTLLVDRVCRFVGVRKFKKKYAIPPPDSHGHGHGDVQSPSEKHSSMAFGGSGHTSMSPSIFSGQGYEVVPTTANPSPLSMPTQYMGHSTDQGTYFNSGIQSSSGAPQNTAYVSDYPHSYNVS